MYLDIYCGFTLLLIFVTLVLATILFKKYVAFYLNFPNASFLLIVLRWMVMSRIKKNLGDTKSLLETAHETCRKLQREGICVLWMHKPFIVICNEETMKVFNNEKCALNKVSEYKLFEECVGVSLITAVADVWKIRRKIFSPAFKLPVLIRHLPMINKNAIALVNKLIAVPEETPVHMVRFVQSCTFANIYEFLSGNKVNNAEREAEVENTIDMIDISAKITTYRLFRPWLYPETTSKFFSKGREYLEIMDKYQDFTKKILLEIKESVLSKKEKDLENYGPHDPPKSFAQLIVQHHMTHPEFTFEDMLNEMKGLILAGYDTVSYALMWALFLLGHHEEVQEKLFNELDGFMDDDLTFDHFQHLPYLDAVVKESLRLYPPVPIIGKSLHEEVQYKQYTFPKGTNLLFCMHVIHRDPKSYSDPEEFYPERFLEKDPDKTTTTYAFAEGSRSCIVPHIPVVVVKVYNELIQYLAMLKDITYHGLYGRFLQTSYILLFLMLSREYHMWSTKTAATLNVPMI